MTVQKIQKINGKLESFTKREESIHNRIKQHYAKRFHRDITDSEAKDIALNLLSFAKALYGVD